MNLTDFFKQNNRAAIAFSGGVDSAYLLYAALKYNADVKAYYVRSAFQPQFEVTDAKRLANILNVDMKVLELDILSDKCISSNPPDRCYHCKKRMFAAIRDAALRDGYSLLLDGTNFSDSAAERPGMRALRELEVRSPLRECQLTKDDIRSLSHEAGLFTWDKPAYACLATRIAAGEEITERKLAVTEHCEGYLHTLGFTDLRIRQQGGAAKLQLREADIPLFYKRQNEISNELKKHYDSVTLDTEVRR